MHHFCCILHKIRRIIKMYSVLPVDRPCLSSNLARSTIQTKVKIRQVKMLSLYCVDSEDCFFLFTNGPQNSGALRFFLYSTINKNTQCNAQCKVLRSLPPARTRDFRYLIYNLTSIPEKINAIFYIFKVLFYTQ